LGYTSIPQIFFLDLVNAHRHAGDWWIDEISRKNVYVASFYKRAK
jgi:hypothetical protein